MQNPAIQFIQAIQPDGRLTDSYAKKMRHQLRSQAFRQQLHDALSRYPIEGMPFEALPLAAQQGLIKLVMLEDTLHGRIVRGYNRRYACARWLENLPLGGLKSLLIKWVWGADHQLKLLGVRWCQLIAWYTGRLSARCILRAIQFDIRAWMGSYISPVAVKPEYAGCYTSGDVTCAYLIGLDLILTEEQGYVIESNLSPALSERRIKVYDQDPVAIAMIAAAKSIQAHTLVIDMAWYTGLNMWFVRQLDSRARQANIRLKIALDTRAFAHGEYENAYPCKATSLVEGKTLIIKMKNNLGGQDLLVHDKLLLNQVLLQAQHHNKTVAGVPEMRIQPHPSWLDDAQPDLPNLVYKYVEEDKGEGVHFMRARSVHHALEMAKEIDRESGLSGGYFQPFICSQLVNDRQFFDIRSFMILMPQSICFAGSLRRINAQPMKPFTSFGRVAEKDDYLTNVSRGNILQVSPQAESQRVEHITMQVGEILRQILVSGFTVVNSSE